MRIYEMALSMVESVCELSRVVQQQDKDLAQQMRRACTSVPLNLQEGLYSRGGSRTARFHDAMGSAKETMACLDVCVAAKYLKRPDVETDLKRIDSIVAGLYCLAYRRASMR